MAYDPCDPNNLRRAAELIDQGKLGETEAESVISSEAPSTDPGVVTTRAKMGFFSNLRTQLGAFGDEFAVKAIQPLQRNNIATENFVTRQYAKYKEALSPLKLDETLAQRLRTGLFGMPTEVDEALQKAIRLTTADGKFTGQPGSFPPHVVDAAKSIRKLYREMGDEFGVDPDTFFQYRDLYYKKPTGIIREPSGAPAEEAVKGRIKPGESSFYDELERKGIVGETDATATADFLAYIHAVANSRIRKPFIDQLEKDVVDPFFDRKFWRTSDGKVHVSSKDPVAVQSWEELKSHIFGAPTPLDRILTYNLKKLAEITGHGDVDIRSSYRIVQSITSLFYGGTLGVPLLGGRPGSVMRQLAQIVPTYAELGMKYTMMGMQQALKPGSIDVLRNKNILSSPLEQVLESVSVARGVGRGISKTTETSLKLFTAVDQFTRSATAYGKMAQFDDYLARGIIEKLPMRKEIRNEVLPLIRKGNHDEAKEMLMFDAVANLQYIYGKANRPAAFRGALGALGGVFMSYPLNSLELLRLFSKQALPEALGGSGNPVPLIRLMGLTSAILWAGSEMLDVDLRSAMMIGALPYSMAFPKMGIDAFQMGRTNYEWLTGNLFMVGETDFHKKIRNDVRSEQRVCERLENVCARCRLCI